LVYTISSPIVGILCKYLEKRLITWAAFIVATVGLFLFGPSYYLKFPDKLSVLVGGGSLIGLAIALIVVPLLSEIIEAVKSENKNYAESELNDKASGIFATAQAIGCIIGPVLGGVLNDVIGYRRTCDVMGISSFTFVIIYTLINVGPVFCKRNTSKVMETTP